MTKFTFTLATITLAVALSGPAELYAGKAEKAKAKRLFRRGKKLFKSKRYVEAVKKFKKAKKYWKHRVIEFNIALSYAFMGKKILAATHLRAYLKKATAAERNLPPVLARVQQQTGALIIVVPDPNAKIFVDGRFVGRTRVELISLTGKRAVDVRVGNRIVAHKIIEVPPAGERFWELAQVPRPGPKLRGPGVAVTAPRTGVPAGPEGPAGATPAVAIKKKSSLARLHWAYFATAAGLAAATLGVAIGMSMRTKKLRNDFLDNRTDGDLRDQAVQSQNIANAMWGVSAGLAVATGVLIIFTRWKSPKKTESAISLLPTFGPGGGGLTLTVRAP